MPNKLSLAALDRLSVEEYKKVDKLPIIVVADNIRSAMNIGSIFRTCDSFAIEQLFLCGISARPPHKEITKTAIGATASVQWKYHKEVRDAITELKEKRYKIIAIEQTDESTYLADLVVNQEKIAIVLGNEVTGVSDEVIQMADRCVEIEQFGTKHSLNVSVCAGIVIHKLSSMMRGVRMS